MTTKRSLHRLNKRLKPLIDFALKEGWEIVHTPGGHLKFTKPGLPPIYTGSTPGDRRAGLNARARLRRTDRATSWTPIELLKHLVYMERRWLVWGFLAEPVPDPSAPPTTVGWWPSTRRSTSSSGRCSPAVSAPGRSSRPQTSPMSRPSADGSHRATRSHPRPSAGSCTTSCRSTPATPVASTSPASSPTARRGSSPDRGDGQTGGPGHRLVVGTGVDRQVLGCGSVALSPPRTLSSTVCACWSTSLVNSCWA